MNLDLGSRDFMADDLEDIVQNNNETIADKSEEKYARREALTRIGFALVIPGFMYLEREKLIKERGYCGVSF